MGIGYVCGGELTTGSDDDVTSLGNGGDPSDAKSSAEINATNGLPCRVSTTRSPP